MATLLEKWETLSNVIKLKHTNWLDGYFKDNPKPKIVFQISAWNKILELHITRWSISEVGNWMPSYYKKPTKKDLQRLIDWDNSFIINEDKIFFHYEYVDSFGGRISGAHNLSKAVKEKNISFNKEDLIPEFNRLKNIYAPREGHFACTYCHKQTPVNEAVEYTVIARQYPNMRKTDKYCSSQCGAKDQMAHEG